MNSFKVLAIVCLVVTKSRSSPIPKPQGDSDLFAGFLRNAQLGAPSKESDIVKRRVFEDNPDRELKQISFHALIGDLEDSLFASALSVHNVINDKGGEISEIKPNTNEQDHKVSRRQLKTEASNIETTTASAVGEARKVILQTTERVPETNELPAHIVIDRISIQPHSGSVALIPSFQIQHTRNDNKSPEITKISISKTEISSAPNTSAPSSTTTESATSAAATSTSDHESTTAKNIEQLKETEAELKEKVAEIEAEPVILSARV